MRRGSRRVEGIAIRIWIEARRRRATDTRARSRARTYTRCCDASMSDSDDLADAPTVSAWLIFYYINTAPIEKKFLK